MSFFNLSVLFDAFLLIICAIHILRYKRDSRAALLWLMIVIWLPFLGSVIYVSIGIDRIYRRALLKEHANQHFRQEFQIALPDNIFSIYLPSAYESNTDVSLSKNNSFPNVLDKICSRPILPGNSIDLMTQGDGVYDQMIKVIECAEHSIHLQTYIFVPDKVGKRITEILIEKADKDIEIRLLCDGVGSMEAYWFLNELSRNTKILSATFGPLSPLKRRWQLNLRNHRKLLLVDGAIAFIGGMNICEKHLVDHPLLTRVKDYHFQVEGPVVHQLQETFIEDWYYAYGEKLLSPKYFPLATMEGDDEARVITSGPDGDYEALYNTIFSAIISANDNIVIVTPYFIPNEGLINALRFSAAKGVRIRLLVPGHSDHIVVTFAARTFYEELMSFGVEIFERKAPFLHSKVLIVDDYWATIGSANMDIRSFKLNFETNLEIRSKQLVKKLLKEIEDDIAESIYIDPKLFKKRSELKRLVENASALLTPIL